MGKAAAFVYFILLGTLLIATAETAVENVSPDDDNADETKASKQRAGQGRRNNSNKGTAAENVTLDDFKAGGTEYQPRRSERIQKMKASTPGNASPDEGSDGGTKSTQHIPRNRGENKNNNTESVAPHDDQIDGTTTRRPNSERGRGPKKKPAGNASPDEGSAEGIMVTQHIPGNRRGNKNNNAENEAPDDDHTEVTTNRQPKAYPGGREKENSTMSSFTDARNHSMDPIEEVGCEIPQAPEHGSVKFQDEPKVGSLALYTCDPGRRLVGEATAECLTTGQWAFDPPQCLNNSVCTSPPEIEGAITPIAENAEYAVGMTVTYSCHYGYVSRNSIHHISVCKINETTRIPEWTLPKITCIPRSCGDPGYVNHGQRIGNLFTFPNKVEYECEEGFKLRGLRARYCQAGGDWSGRLPVCEQIYCTVPPDPVNGRVRYSSLEYGTELRYECNVGFLVEKHQPRICSADGSWSNEEPECVEARCEEPQAPEHGSVQLHGEPKAGSLATYSCDPGKKLVGADTTKCLITGQWTFDPPQCLSSCSVPVIENGEMGKFQAPRWGSNEEFKKVYTGKQVNSSETLFLRCKKGFLPVDDSKFLESNRLEVTCSDGEWSKMLPCEKTSCTGEPPAIKNGNAAIRSREHGFVIWYHCKNPNFVKVDGNVMCNFGKWIGNPPKCLDRPCYTRELQEKKQSYPGLIIPLQEYFETQEGFEIDCEYGFRRATTVRKINCVRSRWDIPQNPCTDENGAITTSVPQLEKTSPGSGHVVHVQLPDNEHLHLDHDEGCFCTYDYENYFLKAKVGNKILKSGDKIMRGQTVALECNPETKLLVWQNGFRHFGKANMTCNTCESWQSKDLPYCTNAVRSDTFIASNKDYKILPGGIMDLYIGGARQFFCTSAYAEPVWIRGGRRGLTEYSTQTTLANGVVMYLKILEVSYLLKDDSGRYECCIPSYSGQCSGSSFLELQVNEVSCPWFPNRIGLIISYSDENKYGSWARFSCASDAKLVGYSTSGCQYDGTWSVTQPYCETTDSSCPLIDGLGIFNIYYDNHRRINSTASLMCKESGKRVEGCSVVSCLPNGTWSGSYPACVDYGSCSRFAHYPGLKVTYSRNVSVGSIATFSCSSSSRNLIGSSVSRCRENGTWTKPLPTCEEPKCSVHNLSMSVPEDVVPDMTGVNDEFLPPGSLVELKCSDNSIMNGNSKALCGEHGKWELGIFQCVPGCVLNLDRSSLLLVHPIQNSYRLGESISLSCPPGKKLSNDVELLMCLNNKWSDTMPDCEESEDSGRR